MQASNASRKSRTASSVVMALISRILVGTVPLIPWRQHTPCRAPLSRADQVIFPKVHVSARFDPLASGLLSGLPPAAIDHLAGDERGVIGGEKGDRTGLILRSSRAFQRLL